MFSCYSYLVSHFIQKKIKQNWSHLNIYRTLRTVKSKLITTSRKARRKVTRMSDDNTNRLIFFNRIIRYIFRKSALKRRQQKHFKLNNIHILFQVQGQLTLYLLIFNRMKLQLFLFFTKQEI